MADLSIMFSKLIHIVAYISTTLCFIYLGYVPWSGILLSFFILLSPFIKYTNSLIPAITPGIACQLCV